jgi:hypothetical protein
LIRGYCYVWTNNPGSTYGTGAVRPTSSGTNTLFNSNLDSARILLPKLPNVKVPRTLVGNPSSTQIDFPSTKNVQGPGQMQVCLFESTSNILQGWGDSTGSQNLRFTSSALTGPTLIATSNTDIRSLFSNLKIQRINNSKFSIHRYFLMRLAPYLGSGITTDCTGSGTNSSVTFTANLWPRQADTFLIDIQPISLTQIRSFTVLPKNGLQNN